MTPDQVRALRESAQMTQDELARYLGLRHRSQVAHLEAGRSQVRGAKLRLLELLRAEVRQKNRRPAGGSP
jgi:DNA-binding transcriptional regulator YiaG